jgi:urea transport system substrate-binding protein
MEATYIGFKMWTQAVLQAGTTDVDAVREALIGQRVQNLTGSTAVMLPDHHLTKPVLIGEIRADGQFNVVSKTKEPVPGEAWASKYLDEDKGKVANWTFPWVCESCTSPTYKAYE